MRLQRNLTTVEVIVLADPGRSTQLVCRADRRDNRLLGFLWSGVSYCDVVLITTQGVELHKDMDMNGRTKPGKTYELKCNW